MKVGRTQPLPCTSDEVLEIGRDQGSPITPDYHARIQERGELGRDHHPRQGADDDAEITAETRLYAALIVK